MAGGTKSLTIQIKGDSKDFSVAVDKVERDLDKAGSAADGATSRFSGLVGKLKELGSGAIKGGIAGLATVGAGMGAAVGKGLSDGLSEQSIGSTLAAQLGTGTDSAGQWGDMAGRLYAQNFGSSVEDAGQAIRHVVQQLGAGDDEWMERISGKALNLSQVFEQDLGGATAAVGQMLKNGLAPDADAAFDILTAGFQSGVDKSGDLLDTFTEYGTQFRELGLSGADAMGLLQQGLQGGARDADTVADALKEYAIRAQDGSKSTAEGFKALGLNADTMAQRIAAGGDTAKGALAETLDKLRAIEDPVQRNAAAVALFGTKAEDLQNSLFALDPTTAVQGLGQVEGAAQRMGDTLAGDPMAKIEAFKRNALGQLADLGAAAMPAIEPILTALTPAISALAPVFTALAPVISSVATTLGGILVQALAAIAPVVVALAPHFAKLVETIGSALMPVIEKLIPPLGEVLVAIAPLLPMIAELAGTVLVSLAEAIAPVISALAPLITQFVDGLKPVMAELQPVIKDLAGKLGRDLLDATVQILPPLMELVVALLPIIPPIVRILAEVLKLTALLPILTTVLGAVATAASWAWREVIWPAIEFVVTWFQTSAMPIIQSVAGFIGNVFSVLATVVSTVWNGIMTAISAVVGWFQGTAWPMIQSAAGLIGSAFDTMKSTVENVWNGIRNAISGVVDFVTGIPGRIRGIWDGIWDGLSSGLRSVIDTVKSLWNGFANTFKIDLPLGAGTIGLPTFHTGGTFHAPRPGGEGLAVLRDGEHISTPGRAPAGGSPDDLNRLVAAIEGRPVHLVVEIDGKQIAYAVRRHDRRLG